MGTYGDITGIVSWVDPDTGEGHLFVLKDGELQTDISGDSIASGATGYDQGEGFWLEKPTAYRTVGSPIGILGGITHSSTGTDPGISRFFVGKSTGGKVLWDGRNLSITGTITATDGDIGGWTINSTYLAKDTGVDATSAGMAPLDYPFYSGATYEHRATGKFRVNAAGELVAEDATVTGEVNWGSGQGQLNSTGLEWNVDANNYVRVDSEDSFGLVRAYRSGNTQRAIYAENTNTGSAADAIYAVARGGIAVNAYDNCGTYGGSTGKAISGYTNGGIAVYGTGNGTAIYGLVASTPSIAGKFECLMSGTAVLAIGKSRFGQATTNYAEFDSTGNLTFEGTAQPWEDVRIEPQARTTGANAPSFEKWYDDVAGTSRGVYLYSFDDATAGSEKEVFFTLQMPHNWNSGDIHLHVHWIGAVADTTATPRWGLEYAWKEPGAAYGDTTIIYAVGNEQGDTDITAHKHYITEFAVLTPGSTADGLSSVMIGRLFRDSANGADTYNATGAKVGLLYIDAHYQIARIGSNDEYTP